MPPFLATSALFPGPCPPAWQGVAVGPLARPVWVQNWDEKMMVGPGLGMLQATQRQGNTNTSTLSQIKTGMTERQQN